MIYVCGAPCSATPRESNDEESEKHQRINERNSRHEIVPLNVPACGTLDGFGGGISSPAPQLIAATLRFSRRIVSLSLERSSCKISLNKRELR